MGDRLVRAREARPVKGAAKKRLIGGTGVKPMAEEHASEGNSRSASVPEIPETSPGRCESSQPMGEDRQTEKRPSNFQTPRRVRFKTEVPSSHTPPSTQYATDEFVRKKRSSLQRSPLAKRSHNLQSPAPTRFNDTKPELRILDTQLPEKVSTAVTSQISSDLAWGHCAERVTEDTAVLLQRANEGHDQLSVLNPCPPPRTALEVDRAHAIEDSQERNRCSLDESPGKCLTSPPPKHENYKRTGVVEDSQCPNDSCPDLVLASIPNEARLTTTTQTPALYPDSDLEVNSCPDDQDLPEADFDPVLSALERDASRFLFTQLRSQTQRSPRAMIDDSETEDDEDLDAGCTNVAMNNRPRRSFSSERIPQLPTNKPLDAVSALGPGNASATRVPTRPVETIREPGRTTGNQQPEAEDSNDAPHSSPPLRPSQVSTVVSTPSPHHTPPRNAPVIDLTNPTPAPAPTFADTEPERVPCSLSKSSPRPSSITLANGTARSLRDLIVPSSPIPLPASDSTEWMECVRRSQPAASWKSQPQLEDLVDFSLPPPPPLLSSSRATPSSSVHQ